MSRFETSARFGACGISEASGEVTSGASVSVGIALPSARIPALSLAQAYVTISQLSLDDAMDPLSDKPPCASTRRPMEVEPAGIEPATSALQTPRSAS